MKKVTASVVLSLMLMGVGFVGGVIAQPAHRPQIEKAEKSLYEAKSALEVAKHDFGGHRVKAMEHINQELREGKINRQQANQLHSEDRQIRQEERTMASHNSGHITKAEQRALNQQENAVNRQIGR